MQPLKASFPRITLARYRIQQRNFGDAQKLLQDGLSTANDNPLIAAELVRLYQQINKLDDALSLALEFQKERGRFTRLLYSRRGYLFTKTKSIPGKRTI